MKYNPSTLRLSTESLQATFIFSHFQKKHQDSNTGALTVWISHMMCSSDFASVFHF